MLAQLTLHRQFLLSALLVLTVPSATPAGSGDLADELASHVESVVAPSGFNGSLLVSVGDEILISRGVGLADAALELANGPRTRFRIGSVSKQFTAAAILLLADREELSLEALAGEYWEDAPAGWSEVTVHHLLNHTSGIHNVTDLPTFENIAGNSMRPEETLGYVVDLPLDFAPGTRWSYSNSGYLLLALIVERVSDERFEDFLARELLAPLGLADTGSESTYDPEAVPMAAGYASTGEEWKPCDPIDMNVPTGGGGMYSTVLDLRTWALAMGAADQVLAPRTWELMQTPGLQDYGYGVLIQDLDGTQRVSHSGGIQGFNSWLAFYPESGAVIAVIANTESADSGEVGAGLERLLLGR